MTEEDLNKYRKKLATAITNRRLELDMSEQDLADRTGLGLSTIQRFEDGRFWLNMKQYIIIRDALDMPEII
jgi:ribosome-binding protein aMBF1 (putative translation factor)